MKNVKKLMKCSLVLCLALALLCMPLGVFAEENVPNGGTSAEESAMTQEEIFAEALADPNLTDEQRADILATKALVEQGIGGAPDVEPPMTRAVNNVMLMTTKMQETSKWCSAATIQQMLIYMTGSSPSQQAIMNSVGQLRA